MKQLLFLLIPLLSPLTLSSQVNHWETAIYGTDTFRYFIGNQNPPADWRFQNFDDSGWRRGKGGLGYGETNLKTIVPDSTLSIYIRKTFTVADSTSLYAAQLNIDYDDGFVAWMNGVEVARENLGTSGDLPGWNTLATSSHEGVMHQGQVPPSFIIKNAQLKKILRKGENVICMQVNNVLKSSSDLTAILYLSFGIKIASHYFDTIPYWFTAPALDSGSLLPLIIINTHGQYIPHVPDKILVDFGIIDNGAGNFNSPTDPWNYFNAKAGLGIHGSSSTMFDKKNYGIEIRDSSGIQMDTSLLGMPTENDFVLYGPYPDKSLLRNYLMYYLGNDIGQYAPRTRMCELYMDNDYRGFYLLVEKIKRDKNRVDIKKLESTDVSGIKLTGGYILKIDRTGANYTDGWWSPYQFLNTSIFIIYEYPKYTEIMPVQKVYIQNKITSFESLLIGDQYRDPVSGYRSLIDAKSFAEHLILSEFCKNVDAYRLSTFFYKDRDDIDPRIHMGPIWDYDLAFGNANYDDASLVTNWEYEYPESGQPFWWQRLMSDPWFANLAKCRYEELRKGPLNIDSINMVIDSAVAKIGPAIQRNFIRWPILGTWVWPNNYVGNTYQQEITYLKQWISERAAWMDSSMPGVCVTTEVANEILPVNSLRAYPNPAMGKINVEFQNPSGESALLEVFNVYGQKSYDKMIKGEVYWLKNIPLPPGSYFLRLTTSSGIKSTKFIIY
jgi:CotH kinase protein/Secretion system C-terminal sorting domain